MKDARKRTLIAKYPQAGFGYFIDRKLDADIHRDDSRTSLKVHL